MFWGLIVGIIFLVVLFIKIITASILLPFLLVYIVIQCFTILPDSKSLYFGSYKEDCARCLVLFGQAKIKISNDALAKQGTPLEYKTIMGSSTIDLTKLDAQTLRSTGQAVVVQCDNSLGNIKIKLAKDMPVHITARAFLGQIELPDDTTIVIGSHTYKSHLHEQPLLIIYSTTILGTTRIEHI